MRLFSVFMAIFSISSLKGLNLSKFSSLHLILTSFSSCSENYKLKSSSALVIYIQIYSSISSTFFFVCSIYSYSYFSHSCSSLGSGCFYSSTLTLSSNQVSIYIFVGIVAGNWSSSSFP